jgi:hypothetical protein
VSDSATGDLQDLHADHSSDSLIICTSSSGVPRIMKLQNPTLGLKLVLRFSKNLPPSAIAKFLWQGCSARCAS